MTGPCARQRVIAEITATDGALFYGENLCYRPQLTCPRGDMPSGKGYHLCKSVCVQSGHAEVNAIAAAGDRARGARLTLFGHTYACDHCAAAAKIAGIVQIRIGGASL